MIETHLINADGGSALAMFSDEALTQVVGSIAESARGKWKSLADSNLSGSRRDYIRGIQPVRLGRLRATVTLVGVLPNLIENGMPQVDMRDTLLGPNVPVAPAGQPGKRQGKNGPDHFYRSIPFRHATPGTTGAVGDAMGQAYGGQLGPDEARKLGKRVYAAAKKLGQDGGGARSKPYGGTAAGKRLQTKLPGAPGPGTSVPLLKDWHATDIYSGMVRQEKVYADEKKKPQASYVTFRTISTDVKNGPMHWIRPATPGKHFAKGAAEFAARITEQSFAQYVEGLSG